MEIGGNVQATVLARRCTALHWADVATVYRQHMLNGVRADDPSSVCELKKKKRTCPQKHAMPTLVPVVGQAEHC